MEPDFVELEISGSVLGFSIFIYCLTMRRRGEKEKHAGIFLGANNSVDYLFNRPRVGGKLME
jgi:hypothetical protein